MQFVLSPCETLWDSYRSVQPKEKKMSDQEQTLYERIGGDDGIRAMVDTFYEKVLGDPVLASYFKDVPMDRQHKMQRQFFSAATGGPAIYSGRPLGEVHKHLGISRHEFKRFTDILISTLEIHDIDQQDVLDIMARINIYADEITNDMTD